MKTLTFKDREDWLAARRGKITGSRLKDIVVKRGTGKKIGFYELIAERLATEPEGDETPMERGTRLEPEALERYAKETGHEIDTTLRIWTRDDNESIAVSPDASVGEKLAVDAKCLSSAKHIEAFLTGQLPDEYEFQKLQYFIANENLEKVDFAFYDPRIPVKDFFILSFTREAHVEEIAQYLAYQEDTLEEVNRIVTELSF